MQNILIGQYLPTPPTPLHSLPTFPALTEIFADLITRHHLITQKKTKMSIAVKLYCLFIQQARLLFRTRFTLKIVVFELHTISCTTAVELLVPESTTHALTCCVHAAVLHVLIREIHLCLLGCLRRFRY